jgi:tetratricopeptide (TPR) repeat protein
VTPPGPAATDYWENQAAALEKSQDWHGLLAHCRRWTQAQPDDASAYFHLGLAYNVLGRHREAVEACRETLRLKPDCAEAWYGLSAAYALSGNRSAALEAVKELRRYDSQKADELFNLIMKP